MVHPKNESMKISQTALTTLSQVKRVPSDLNKPFTLSKQKCQSITMSIILSGYLAEDILRSAAIDAVSVA